MFFSRVKPMMNSEEICGGLTAVVTDVSNVMSADDEMSIRELSRLIVQSFAKKKQHCCFTK